MSLFASEVHVVTRIIQGLSRFGMLLAYFIHKFPLDDVVQVVGVLCYRIVDVLDTRCLHLGIFLGTNQISIHIFGVDCSCLVHVADSDGRKWDV